MNYAQRMIAALTGPKYGLLAAWLMFLSSYSYSRSWDGVPIDAEGKIILRFGRWESFCDAVRCGWWYLWRRDG